MASYNEIDGVPSHANRWLLRDVLRKEWGFDGFVVSDYYAIWELSDRPDTHGHFVAARQEGSLRAGGAGRREHRIARAGLLPAPRRTRARRRARRSRELDELVAPMLLWKFEMGLFDDPYVDPDEAERIVGCDAQPRARAAGGARNDHAAQERRQRAAARPSTRSRRSPSSARTRTAACSAATAACRSTTSPCSTAFGRASATTREGRLQRRLQDHASAARGTGRSRARAIPTKTAGRSPRPSRSRRTPT